jgi:hypothetical protein
MDGDPVTHPEIAPTYADRVDPVFSQRRALAEGVDAGRREAAPTE